MHDIVALHNMLKGKFRDFDPILGLTYEQSVSDNALRLNLDNIRITFNREPWEMPYLPIEWLKETLRKSSHNATELSVVCEWYNDDDDEIGTSHGSLWEGLGDRSGTDHSIKIKFTDNDRTRLGDDPLCRSGVYDVTMLINEGRLIIDHTCDGIASTRDPLHYIEGLHAFFAPLYEVASDVDMTSLYKILPAESHTLIDDQIADLARLDAFLDERIPVSYMLRAHTHWLKIKMGNLTDLPLKTGIHTFIPLYPNMTGYEPLNNALTHTISLVVEPSSLLEPTLTSLHPELHGNVNTTYPGVLREDERLSAQYLKENLPEVFSDAEVSGVIRYGTGATLLVNLTALKHLDLKRFAELNYVFHAGLVPRIYVYDGHEIVCIVNKEYEIGDGAKENLADFLVHLAAIQK